MHTSVLLHSCAHPYEYVYKSKDQKCIRIYETTLSQKQHYIYTCTYMYVGTCRLNQTCSESLVAGHFKRTVNTLVWPFKAVMMSGVCSRRFLELGSAPALRRILAISGFSLREGRERMVNFTTKRLLHRLYRLPVSIIAMVTLRGFRVYDKDRRFFHTQTDMPDTHHHNKSGMNVLTVVSTDL